MEAATGLEPVMEVLQTSALATWRRRLAGSLAYNQQKVKENLAGP